MTSPPPVVERNAPHAKAEQTARQDHDGDGLMIRRAVLAGRRGTATRNDARMPDGHIELDPSDHEEPTWEVRQPGDGRRRRLDPRTRAILTGAAVAAIVVNAGAAWVYWRVTGSETAHAGAGAVSMALRARSDLNEPLRPGGTGNITVTVTNGYDFPVRITSLTAGTGNIVADDEHRDKGCTDVRVAITQPRFEVDWEVRRNSIGAFTVPDGLIMRGDADPACAGAVFTVPVQVFGVRRDPS